MGNQLPHGIEINQNKLSYIKKIKFRCIHCKNIYHCWRTKQKNNYPIKIEIKIEKKLPNGQFFCSKVKILKPFYLNR
jgi:hypothetical protein